MRTLHYSKIIFILITAFLTANCKKISANNQTSVAVSAADTTKIIINPGETDSKIYLALGDSYTIGQSVDSSQRFPAQTVALLQKHGISISHIQYIATSGWTTLDLLSAIELQKPKGAFAAVSLLIGVNDQHQSGDTTSYRQNFIEAIKKALELADNNVSHVFVLSIPDYGVTPFGANNKEISKQIDMFNAINKNVTNSFGISYTDITDISRNDGSNPNLIAPDGLHPSGEQYAQWAQVLEPAMYKALK